MHITGFVALSLSSLVVAIPYSEYILAPDSRTLHPVSVYQINGTVSGAETLTGDGVGSAVFDGVSSVTFDFEKNIGGVVSITVGSSSSPDAVIGLTYTESSLYVTSEGSDATGPEGIDEALWLPVGEGPGTYAVERFHDRGAFKYLNLISNTTSTIEVTSVSINFTAAPVQDLKAYRGYFHSNDELLNRIWYAGAYTNQLCNVDPKYGNALIHFDDAAPINTWYNNATITEGSSAVTDGAKRDRLVWPGDMSIALPSIFVSTNDLDSVRNSLNSLLALQNATTGLLPYAGTPFSDLGIVSFTYHLYSLIGISYFYQYSGDLAYLQSTWSNFTKGIAWSLSSVDESGLMNVTSIADWLRFGMGGHNIEANAILYYTLNEGINLAAILNDTTSAANWGAVAATLKEAANNLLWDESSSLYRDNETTTLHPQDGNVWAIKSNLTLSSNQTLAISEALKLRWGPYGAPAPEAGATVSPFISSFELEAHLLAGSAQASLDLMRLQWGFMLDDPRMTNSTFVEGYSTDGSLHYAPYVNDQRVSFAHGWSTGPTSLLSFYVAGIHLVESIGQVWRIEPQVGDLTSIETGFETPLGGFTSTIEAENGIVTGLKFSTPEGTTGSVALSGVEGTLVSSSGAQVQLVNGIAAGLAGGNWTLTQS